MRSKITFTLLLSMLSLPMVAADGPALDIGIDAPDLTLPAADGVTRSLTDAQGPTVLIFFRGLW